MLSTVKSRPMEALSKRQRVLLTSSSYEPKQCAIEEVVKVIVAAKATARGGAFTSVSQKELANHEAPIR